MYRYSMLRLLPRLDGTGAASSSSLEGTGGGPRAFVASPGRVAHRVLVRNDRRCTRNGMRPAFDQACAESEVVSSRTRSAPDADRLAAMRDALSHRGPDDWGIEVIDNVGLVHTRLSIVDLSERGHQPMVHPDGRLVDCLQRRDLQPSQPASGTRARRRAVRGRQRHRDASVGARAVGPAHGHSAERSVRVRRPRPARAACVAVPRSFRGQAALPGPLRRRSVVGQRTGRPDRGWRARRTGRHGLAGPIRRLVPRRRGNAAARASRAWRPGAGPRSRSTTPR